MSDFVGNENRSNTMHDFMKIICEHIEISGIFQQF